MSDITVDFQRDGVVVLPEVISDFRLEEIKDSCEKATSDVVGTRNLLNFDWAKNLAEELKTQAEISRAE